MPYNDEKVIKNIIYAIGPLLAWLDQHQTKTRVTQSKNIRETFTVFAFKNSLINRKCM